MMNKEIEKIIVVIPSLNPDDKLIVYVNELLDSGFNKIIIVNDGSSAVYDSVFDALKQKTGVYVLKHEVNKGKGGALKTAYKYIKDNFIDSVGVLSVDSDGQHLTKDCVNIAELMLQGDDGLYLGCRDFNDEKVPFKSKFGNRLTSFLFKLLYKRKLDDTQTGLRGFLINRLDFMIDIEGDRYEYEMETLIKASLIDYKFIEVPIDTIYINQNESSHFRPLKDGLKIYKILFRKHNK